MMTAGNLVLALANRFTKVPELSLPRIGSRVVLDLTPKDNAVS